jgi:tetratricopeptide (TPR) repeat protein
MLFDWFNAREAAAVGAALADDFVLQSASAPRNGQAAARGQELQKFLQKFLQRVDRDARPLQLNLFKRAKLANSFKWRLLEKGVERDVVDELTQALVLRLNATPGTASPAGAARGTAKHDPRALLVGAAELLARGAYAEALAAYEALVELEPRDAPARNGLGAALAELGRYAEAEDQFRRAIGLRPDFAEAQFNLAGVLQSTGRHNEAENPLRRALKLKPSYIEARIRLGMSLAVLGRLSDARECYDMALRAAPRSTQALTGLGQVEALEGHFAAAESAYRRALELDPTASYAWAALTGLRRMTAADEAWLKRAEELVGGALAPIDESTLRFAMGKFCDDVGDYPRAFRNFQRANELHKARAPAFSAAAYARFVDDAVKVYTRDALGGARAGASDSARPVLVTGMPRSGTSLVEQIIASHPQARGAGELEFWSATVHKHESALRRALLELAPRQKLAGEYLRVLRSHSSDAQRVIDKAPVNADYLGLVHSVFPNARLIYLRRDPIDTCLSCYFQQFPPAMSFTMDLADLAAYYREHHRLVAHWRAVLPAEAFLDVPYAELVAGQEKWTRRILEFLGLPWDERCLSFYQTVRPVSTASAWQVRQKIYSSSVERWRHYEKFIGPLRSLEPLGA